MYIVYKIYDPVSEVGREELARFDNELEAMTFMDNHIHKEFEAKLAAKG